MTQIAALAPLEQATRLGLMPPDTEPERQALYKAVLENQDFSVLDLQTLRDLLLVTGLPASAALEAGLMALFTARREGSLCLRVEQEAVERRLPEFANRSELVAQFLKIMAGPGSLHQLVGKEATDFVPLIQKDGWLYFQRALQDEEALRAGYELRFGEEPAPGPAEITRLKAILTGVLQASPLQNGKTIVLNEEQQLALGLALLKRFLVVTGGPGTGKTSIVLALLRCMVRGGTPAERIALAAPTGRAAQRMTESMRTGLSRLPLQTGAEATLQGLEGQTLHRLLGYSPGRNSFTFHQGNPLDLDVLIVDEVSMIDATLMASVLDAVPAHTRLIFLGDVHQLPSVEAGAVLADLVPVGTNPGYTEHTLILLDQILGTNVSARELNRSSSLLADRVVRLTRDYRSHPQIGEVARLVNTYEELREKELLNLLTADDTTCTLQSDALSGAAWHQEINQWAQRHYLSQAYRQAIQNCVVQPGGLVPETAELKAVLDQLNLARILTVVHDGARGCSGINNRIAEYLRPQLARGEKRKYFAGTPLMVTRNDYALQLFNGDTGILLPDTEGGQQVAFPRGQEVLLVPVANLPEHVPAFAITVHKSQGSEYEHVMLVLPAAAENNRTQRLLTREIVYTAITRARESVQINSSREVLLAACLRRVERDSGLTFQKQ